MYRRLKARGARDGRTVKSLILEGTERILRPEVERPARKVTLPLITASFLFPAINDDLFPAINDEPHGLEQRLRPLTRSRRASPKTWADAYLIAFAETSQMTLVTFDRAFRGKAKPILLRAECRLRSAMARL